MELSRRNFLKSGVAAAPAIAVGIPVSRVASAAAAETEQDWRWDNGGRFCGVGCGIMIATQDGQIVATKGDPDAPVNRARSARGGSAAVCSSVPSATARRQGPICWSEMISTRLDRTSGCFADRAHPDPTR
jgi:hypothetical protein